MVETRVSVAGWEWERKRGACCGEGVCAAVGVRHQKTAITQLFSLRGMHNQAVDCGLMEGSEVSSKENNIKYNWHNK